MALLPRNKQLHVGIEVECFSLTKTLGQARDFVTENSLDYVLEVGTDGSIEDVDDEGNGDRDDGYGFDEGGNFQGMEIRFCSPIASLEDNLQYLKGLLEFIKAKSNSSCGLHVHLDARTVDKKAIMRRLYSYQRDLFNAVDTDRRTNDFCLAIPNVPELREIIDEEVHNHYHGISGDPSDTVEVRIHHGTTKAIQEIFPWARLLINIGLKGTLTDQDKTYLKRKADKYGKTDMDNIPNLIYRPASGLYANSLREGRRRTRA